MPPSSPIPSVPPETETTSTLPLPLSASLILTSLPPDAHTALATPLPSEPEKVTIHLQPIGSAPRLSQLTFRISSKNRFETVVKFLRTRLRVKREEGVFCYVNNVFAPGLDEGVGGLWRCFKTDDQLIVGYSMTPAFG